MPFSTNSSPACALHADRSCPKKLSSEYQLYACLPCEIHDIDSVAYLNGVVIFSGIPRFWKKLLFSTAS